MTASLSTRQIRLVALLVMIVVFAGGYMVVTQHKSSTTTTRTTASSTPAVTTPARTTPAPSKAHTHPATPVALRTHGLPVTVARALKTHSVVVVSLTAPRGGDDEVTRLEAKAGATAMNAGYVNINVFLQRPGSTMLRKLGVVDTPDVLVVKRNGTILSDFHGFVDRDVVAQAVAEAR
jgi:hypothetical protein